MENKELASYHNGKKRRHRVAAFAFNDEGKLLSYYKTGVNPELPGGGIDIGENAIIAAARETMEEAGWIVKDCSVVNTDECIYVDTAKDNQWFVDGGWEEEIEYAVICKAVEFKPNSLYAKSVDSNPFTFNHVSEVKAWITNALDQKEVDSLRRYHLSFILMVLEGLEPNTKVRNFQAPISSRW